VSRSPPGPGETLVPMASVAPLSLVDVGKSCEVVGFEGLDGVLMWMGHHSTHGRSSPDGCKIKTCSRAWCN
jgi:hypothetical protein